jgi:class 3 adenylate cyclase
MQPQSGLPTGTVTFLFTDIEGSTVRWERFPRAMQVALARHDTIMRQVIEANGGHVFKTVGDAFCAAFATAPQAVVAALESQRALQATEWGDIGTMKVRMALHTGLGEVRDNDYFGQPLNRVARLLSAGYGGQVLLSLATQQLVRDHLPAGVDLIDLGEGGLKDLLRAEHVYQLVAPDLPSSFPPLKSLDPNYVEPDASGREVKNPYKGLRAFHQEDAGDFFGREELVQRMVQRLGEAGALSSFLAVVGPSGSGKSSAVRAGLIPALRSGALPGSDRWLIAEMLPGAHPLEELEAILLSIAVNPPESLLGQLKEDERGLLRAAKRVLPRDESIELVLLVDQFEEVFSLVEEEPVRVHFLQSLHAVVTDPRSRVRIIVTLRADFYDRPLLYPDPGELVRQRTEVVLPLNVEELERAIVRPAAQVGVQVEPELIAAIVKDVGEQPGTLPLLQYSLTELFDRRRGRVLSLEDYRASGGVLGALSNRAETIYAELDSEKQEATRQLFLRLITLGEGAEDTRRRVRRAELAALGTDGEAISSVIETFGRYRLLTFDRDPITHDSTVEVAHEALIRTWPRLWGWLEASREKLRVQRQLAGASAEWAKSGKDPSFLASGGRLSQFEALSEAGAQDHSRSEAVALTADEIAYLQASVTERERARVARERLRRRITVGLLMGMVLTLILAALAIVQSVQANEQRNIALSQANARATAQAVAETRGAEAFSRELAAKAKSQLAINPNLALLLGIEAGKSAGTQEAEDALRQALIETQPHWVLKNAGIAPMADAEFARHGDRVATTGAWQIPARVWEVSDRTGNTGNVVAEFHLGNDQYDQLGVSFSADAKRVLVVYGDKKARVWDVETQKMLFELGGTTETLGAANFSPDGKLIVTSSRDNTARVWDAQTGKEVRTLAGHTWWVNSAAFSPDSTRIVTASQDGTARIWDAATGKSILELKGHTTWVEDAEFSPDGKRVVTASADKTARVWDAAMGDSILTLAGHEGRLVSAAFSPDGRLIVTGSEDNKARIWDATSGKLLATVKAGDIAPAAAGSTTDLLKVAPASHVAFSPDGKLLLFVTAGTDRAARIYPWELFEPLDRLMSFAPGLAPRALTCEERQTYLHETEPCGSPTPVER